jgi:DNA invertase Pin-like site-specific DNA recombinase
MITEMIDLYYNKNKSFSEISKIMDVPKSVVRKEITKTKDWKIDVSDQDIFRKYVVEKKTPKEIAMLYNCSVAVVYNRINKRGWKNKVKHIPDGIIEDMIKEKPVSVISEELGISKSSIYKKLKKENIIKPLKRKKRDIKRNQDERIVELFKKGTPTKDIVVIVGLSPATVNRRLKKHRKY